MWEVGTGLDWTGRDGVCREREEDLGERRPGGKEREKKWHREEKATGEFFLKTNVVVMGIG